VSRTAYLLRRASFLATSNVVVKSAVILLGVLLLGPPQAAAVNYEACQDTDCCGGTAFNRDEEVCCPGNPQAGPGNTCCGSTPITTPDQSCCGGQVVTGPCPTCDASHPCPTGQCCNNGVCGACACPNGLNCPLGYCCDNGTCVAACPSGKHCEYGRCIPDDCREKVCDLDYYQHLGLGFTGPTPACESYPAPSFSHFEFVYPFGYNYPHVYPSYDSLLYVQLTSPPGHQGWLLQVPLEPIGCVGGPCYPYLWGGGADPFCTIDYHTSARLNVQFAPCEVDPLNSCLIDGKRVLIITGGATDGKFNMDCGECTERPYLDHDNNSVSFDHALQTLQASFDHAITPAGATTQSPRREPRSHNPRCTRPT
jgi:hypothetical protein